MPDSAGTGGQARVVVAVLGMGRSGTSMFSASLEALGVALGADLMVPTPYNPKGHWEHNRIVALDQRILDAFGARWDTPGLDAQALHAADAVATFAPEAARVLTEQFSAARVFGFKDPRMPRLLPIWQTAFARLGLDDRYLIVCRHPLSVADSLAKRDQSDRRKTFLLWLEYTLAALRHTAGKRRVLVDYDRFMQDPRRALLSLHRRLGLPTVIDDEVISRFTRGFVERALRHSEYSLEDLDAQPDVVPCLKAAYRLLSRVTADALDLESAAFSGEWAQVEAEYLRMGPAVGLIGSLDGSLQRTTAAVALERQEHAEARRQLKQAGEDLAQCRQANATLQSQLEQAAQERAAHAEALRRQTLEIAAMRRTRSWRLTAPLRRLVDQLRH